VQIKPILKNKAYMYLIERISTNLKMVFDISADIPKIKNI
jgi:hypothetical protein